MGTREEPYDPADRGHDKPKQSEGNGDTESDTGRHAYPTQKEDEAYLSYPPAS